MKIAVVYNRESQNVINLFGTPNREKIGMKTIDRLVNALKKGRHQVISMEADKDLVDRLEDFMPRVVKGERPGMVFNVSYGIQGQARYTHVPSILEMMGIPYVGSGPLAHSLALDKVVTKMILLQHGLPTAEFAVLDSPQAEVPDLEYPLIVKPKNESVSFGIKVVHDDQELRDAAGIIFKEYEQPVLVERYIEGREVNVGLLGNAPPEAFPPVELTFGETGPKIYTLEDKKGISGRQISHVVPAPIGKELAAEAQEISVRAFTALGCYDCARVDLRLDAEGRLYILEINSLPSLGEHGSYLIGADAVGLDFGRFVNRLVEVASARYFGTPEPEAVGARSKEPAALASDFLTQRRDALEKCVRGWSELSSNTGDPVGLEEANGRLDATLRGLGLRQVSDLTDETVVTTWESEAGLDDGTLLIVHLDVPTDANTAPPVFRREPEWLYGDGIATSRAPLAMIEYAIRGLRSVKLHRKIKLGVLCYHDEGMDARYSSKMIRQAVARARQVLVLRPGHMPDCIVSKRRGHRTYRFRAIGDALRPGRESKRPEVLRWLLQQIEKFSQMTKHGKRISVSILDIKSEKHPLHLPHRATATLLMTYPDMSLADELEEKLRAGVEKRGPKWELRLISDRPAMRDNRKRAALKQRWIEIAEAMEMPVTAEGSVWPSVAGLVPDDVPCLCGISPIATDLGTPQEAVQRMSLLKRTLLLTRFLVGDVKEKK